MNEHARSALLEAADVAARLAAIEREVRELVDDLAGGLNMTGEEVCEHVEQRLSAILDARDAGGEES